MNTREYNKLIDRARMVAWLTYAVGMIFGIAIGLALGSCP